MSRIYTIFWGVRPFQNFCKKYEIATLEGVLFKAAFTKTRRKLRWRLQLDMLIKLAHALPEQKAPFRKG